MALWRVTLLEKYIAQVINLVFAMVIARLLSPAEIGVFTIVAGLMSLAQVIRDFGVGSYIIQMPVLTRTGYRRARAITVGFALAIGALALLISGPIAAFYEEPGMQTVLQVLSVNIFAYALSAPRNAILVREMKFQRIMIISVASTFVNAVLAISLALKGFSYMSLAWAALGSSLTTLILVTWSGRIIFEESDTGESFAQILAFGTRVVAGSLVIQLGLQSILLTIGKAISVEAAGIYSKGQGLVDMFQRDILGAAVRVALPAFANEARKGSDLAAVYTRSVAMITGFGWPVMVFIGVAADPLVHVLFGDQWGAAVPIARILGIASAINIVTMLAGRIQTATGRVQDILTHAIWVQGSRIVILLLIVDYGIQSVALSQIAVYLVSIVVTAIQLKKSLKLDTVQSMLALRASAGVTVAVAFALISVLTLLPDSLSGHALITLCILAAVAFISWVAGIFAFRHTLADELRLGWATTAKKFKNRSEPD